MRIHIGTSGYNYPEWRGTFYPEDLRAPQMFAYYAERFGTVEINATFYRMPTPKTTAAWRDQAPDTFRYALKASRRITHEQRLRDCEDSVRFFCESARVLGPRLGPLLFQLPPNLKADEERLARFLTWLPPDLGAAFEFRHESWLTERVFALLSEHHVALCIADFGDHATPLVPTARHGYFRLRDEGYTQADLERWADDIAEREPEWDEVFVYFKHEEEGKGPEFARAFRDTLRNRHAALSLA
jgi:uncharacterized protein YecE (DUF72 family)